jgi:putative oxidoreductase
MPLMWGLLALSVLIQGGGKFSVDHKIGREF